jgi:hypothetical protein
MKSAAAQILVDDDDVFEIAGRQRALQICADERVAEQGAVAHHDLHEYRIEIDEGRDHRRMIGR